MSKYNLDKYKTDDRIVDYVLPFADRIVLKIKHAGRSNKQYLAAVANINSKQTKGQRAQRQITTPQTIAEALDKDRDMFAKYIVVGWDGVKNADTGQPIQFSQSECLEFLYAIPDWVMQELGVFAAEPMNFVGDDEPTAEEVDEQAGE